MALKLRPGVETVSLQQDAEGYRTIKAKYIVHTTEGESVFSVLNFADLPQPGSIWREGDRAHPGADVDPDIFCTPETDVSLFVTKDYKWYEIVRTFSNKPIRRCVLNRYEDPLLEPAKISGRFNKYTEEAAYDQNYFPILSSSGEMMRGPAVEFDDSRFTVKIEQNVRPIDLPLLYSLKDTVNKDIMWGFPPRSVKVSGPQLDKKFYGPAIETGSGTSTGTLTRCQIYWARAIEFDVWLRRDPADPGNPMAITSGHDRILADEGAKVLKGRWESRKDNLLYAHWVLSNSYTIDGSTIQPRPELGETTAFHPRQDELDEYKDSKGNPTRALLNGQALPANTRIANPVGPNTWQVFDSGPQAKILVKKYPQADLIGLLGLPSNLEE